MEQTGRLDMDGWECWEKRVVVVTYPQLFPTKPAVQLSPHRAIVSMPTHSDEYGFTCQAEKLADGAALVWKATRKEC